MESSLERNILINATNSPVKVSFRKIIVDHLFLSFSNATAGFNCINQGLKLNQIKLKVFLNASKGNTTDLKAQLNFSAGWK